MRWADGLNDDARKDLESQHALVSPAQIEGSTWSYVLLNVERAHLRTLINDSAVLDTHGLKRATQELDEEIPFYLGLQRRYSVLRLRLAPGVFSGGNARAWFYDVTLLTPIMGLVVLAWLLWRNEIDRSEASVVAMACPAEPDHRADDRTRCGRVTAAGRRKPSLRGRCMADRTLPQSAGRGVHVSAILTKGRHGDRRPRDDVECWNRGRYRGHDRDQQDPRWTGRRLAADIHRD